MRSRGSRPLQVPDLALIQQSGHGLWPRRSPPLPRVGWEEQSVWGSLLPSPELSWASDRFSHKGRKEPGWQGEGNGGRPGLGVGVLPCPTPGRTLVPPSSP